MGATSLLPRVISLLPRVTSLLPRVIVLAAAVTAVSRADAELPTVASINLCTDQLVLSLAAREQILTVSWLAADPEESMLAETARAFPLNYGTAEEMLRHAPDVVVAGTFTSTFTRRLLRELGYTVVDVAPAESLGEIERNLRQVAAAIERTAAAERLIAEMHEHAARIVARRPANPMSAVVVRPGGFTVGANTLADELLTLAGLRNVAAEQGLDRWGSLSVETLILSRPELLVLTDYRKREHSLANAALAHPIMARLASTVAATSVPSRYWACGIPRSLESAEMLLHARGGS